MAEIPTRITRNFIREHKNIIFVFGDTLHHDGAGGQAYEARGEVNAYSVPVKKAKCFNDYSAFFTDSDFEWLNKPKIDEAISLIFEASKGKQIVCFPKLGKGWNELQVRAPRTYAYLMGELKKLL